MADSKLTAVTSSTTAVADTDLFYTVEDVATTPVSKRKAWSVLKSTLKTYFDSLYLLPSLFTAKGSLITASAASTPAELAAGTDYWSLAYKAANANGIALAPQETILASAGYLATANSTTETTVVTVSVPGNALSTGTLIYEAWFAILNNAGSGSHKCQAKIYYDSLTLTAPAAGEAGFDNSVNYGLLYIKGFCSAAGATNAQWMMLQDAHQGGGHVEYKPWGGYLPTAAAGSIDSTTAKTAKITITFDTANANCISKCLYATIKLAPIGALT